MTSLAMPLRAALPIIDTLLERQRTLAAYGMAALALTAIAIVLQAIDGRTLTSGVGIWVKPAKFFFSVGIFSLTAAWFFGYVRPERRRSRAMRATVTTLITAATFELGYICWQAARALDSHFNTDTPFHAVMYALMGIGATLLVATTLPVAWEIARRPAAGLQRSFVAAVVIGLVLTFILGGGLGGYMSSQAGHAVGPTGGHTPIFGWNRLGGDLRIAHFLGIHAEQAMPILGLLIARRAPRLRWALLGAGALAYTALTLAIFAQAVAGRPLIPA